MASLHSLKLALQLSAFSLFALNFYAIPILALNVGIQANAGPSQCSRTCESLFCNVPPFLRYGKYCGILYSGCPGERPCDGLDECCMKHDACIGAKNNDYLSQECNQNFLNCVDRYQRSGSRTFEGNKCQVDQVIKVVTAVIDAALLAGRYLHKP